MRESTHMGMNRTGIDMSPLQSKEMIKGGQDVAPAEDGKSALAATMREYVQMADAVGSVPMPGSLKGALVSLKDKVTGKNPEVLINKLGERLAFERTGVRLYEAMIAKCEVALASQGGAIFTVDELRHFRDEEQAHFAMLTEVMESIGADPTAQTPDADVAGVASMGLAKVITDPRTSVMQSLQALLSAELTDNASWELLVTLCDDMGMTDVADRFRQALRDEENHLRHIKSWYAQMVVTQGGATPSMKH